MNIKDNNPSNIEVIAYLSTKYYIFRLGRYINLFVLQRVYKINYNNIKLKFKQNSILSNNQN